MSPFERSWKWSALPLVAALFALPACSFSGPPAGVSPDAAPDGPTVTCTPGEATCEGNTRSVCNAEGTGFLFRGFESEEMLEALRRALAIHKQPDLWRTLQRNGMSRDFSWRASADGYDALYAEARARVAAGRLHTLEDVPTKG